MFEPDFFDPAFQADEPQSAILRLLRGLADTWQPFLPATHAEKMAIGVLILTDGVQVGEGAIGPEVCLTLCGSRWQRCLNANPDEPIKANGSVLKFIWDRMPDRPGNTHEAPDPSTSGAEAPAADDPPPVAPERTENRPEAAPDLTDEAALADLLNARHYPLEAAYVRHFKGRTSTTWQDLVEAVCGRGEEREWATIKTWQNRVTNALRDVAPGCRLSFRSTSREFRIIKTILPE